MIEINLIPDVKQELLKAQRTRGTVIYASIVTCIVAAALVAILAVYVYGIQFARDIFANDAIKTGSEKLLKVEDLSKVLTIQNQINRINELNGTKQTDSRLFDMLAAVIPPEPNGIQVSSLTLDTELKTFTLEGQTRAYDSMEVFKKTLDSSMIEYTQDGTTKQDKLAKDISITDVSYGENEEGKKVLRFKLTFTYADNLLSASVPVIAFKQRVDGNVTDSYLGIPKSIFTERAKDV